MSDPDGTARAKAKARGDHMRELVAVKVQLLERNGSFALVRKVNRSGSIARRLPPIRVGPLECPALEARANEGLGASLGDTLVLKVARRALKAGGWPC